MSATLNLDRRFDLDGPLACGSAITIPAKAAPVSTYKPPAFPSNPRSSSYPIPQNTRSDLTLGSHPNMRTFCINGPYGMNISLSTAVAGKFSIAFNNRARSEPPSIASAHTPTFSPTYSLTIPVDNVRPRIHPLLPLIT